MRLELYACVGRARLPNVAEDDDGDQYEAAHGDRDQQGHVVDLPIDVD